MSEGGPPRLLSSRRLAQSREWTRSQKPEALGLWCLWVTCLMEGGHGGDPGRGDPGSRRGRQPGFGAIASVPLRLKGDGPALALKLPTLVPQQSQVGRWACDPWGGAEAFLGDSSQLGSPFPRGLRPPPGCVRPSCPRPPGQDPKGESRCQKPPPPPPVVLSSFIAVKRSY